ncbi:MAG TPA: hypothetical protein VF841_18205 [Anaeromyxobacter sp.]
MLRLELSRVALLLGPLLAIGFLAGVVRALAQRPGVSPDRRRRLEIVWVLMLLVGAPIWLVLAVVIGVW